MKAAYVGFAGIEGAESALSRGLSGLLGGDVEVRTFAPSEVNEAARFLVSVVDGKPVGSGNRAFLAHTLPEEQAKRAGRLSRAGVTVTTFEEDFPGEVEAEAVEHWAVHGTTPEPEPTEDDILASLLDDDDDDDDFVSDMEPEPEDAPEIEEEPFPTLRDDEPPLPGTLSGEEVAPATAEPEFTSDAGFDHGTRDDEPPLPGGLGSAPIMEDASGPEPDRVELQETRDDEPPLPGRVAPPRDIPTFDEQSDLDQGAPPQQDPEPRTSPAPEAAEPRPDEPPLPGRTAPQTGLTLQPKSPWGGASRGPGTATDYEGEVASQPKGESPTEPQPVRAPREYADPESEPLIPVRTPAPEPEEPPLPPRREAPRPARPAPPAERVSPDTAGSAAELFEETEVRVPEPDFGEAYTPTPGSDAYDDDEFVSGPITTESNPAAELGFEAPPQEPVRREQQDFLQAPLRRPEPQPQERNGLAPFERELPEESHRAQHLGAELRRNYGSGQFKAKRSDTATIFWVSGSHGGSGKTTMAWLMANLTAFAMKKAGKGDEVPVWLIEADWGNSKLAQRLNLARDVNSGHYAGFLEQLQTTRANRTNMGDLDLSEMKQQAVERTIHMEPSGLRVVACPYQLTGRKGNHIKFAIQQITEHAEKMGGYVFIDADTLSNDDPLDVSLARKAHHVVLVSDAGHLDDVRRAVSTLVTPQQANGMGVPRNRISLFFNQTSYRTYKELENEISPYSVGGFLPYISEIAPPDSTADQQAWVGNIAGTETFQRMLVHIAQFLNNIAQIPEIVPMANREQTNKPKQGKLLSRLRRAGR